MTQSVQPLLSQIALSCIDLVQTEQWLREGLGLAPAGGARLKAGTPFTRYILNPQDAEAVCWWMLVRNPGFRIALLQFSSPLPRLQAADFRPCDIGYTRIGIHLPAFDEALGNLARLGTLPVGPILGSKSARRACVRSPDGVFFELMEQDPLPGARRPVDEPAAVRSITLSTPDLGASVADLEALTVTAPTVISLHDDRHEALWGLEGSRCTRAVFRSGDVLIELAEYSDPVGRARAMDYRVSDQGILGMSFSVGAASRHEEACRRVLDTGMYTCQRDINTPTGRAAYVKDRLGFPVELTWVKARPESDIPSHPRRGRPIPATYRVNRTVTVDAPIDRVWAALNDHERMGRWIGADRFEVTKHGTPDSAGYGAERLLVTQGRNVLQQVTRVIPRRHIGYRAIAGTPFSYHNGTVDLRESKGRTQVDWRIRFQTGRTLGPLVSAQLRKGIGEMLTAFKAMVEGDGAGVMQFPRSDHRSGPR